MTKDKSRIQSCIDHINTAIDVDPWAKELVAEMGKEVLKAQLSGEDATSDLQQTCNQLATDCISRQAVIDICNHVIDLWQGQLGEGALVAIKNAINNLPSVQPEPLSDAYMKAVWTWLLDYQIKAAELKGRYTPYEVLSWVANDWRKEHE